MKSMHSHVGRSVARALALAGGVGLAICGTAAWAQQRRAAEPEQAMLRVAQDESSVERLIAAHIKKAHGITAREQRASNDEDDLILVYGLSPGDAPEVQAIVDTGISARDKSERAVTERVVHIRFCYRIPQRFKTKGVRERLLDLNNRFMRKCWMPHSVTVDNDDDIWMECHINIPGKAVPIPADMVHDCLMRLVTAWEDYYGQLETVLRQGSSGGRQYPDGSGSDGASSEAADNVFCAGVSTGAAQNRVARNDRGGGQSPVVGGAAGR